MPLKRLARFACLLSLVLGCSALSQARQPPVGVKSPPAAADPGAGTFTSLEGRFAIALPPQISGFRGITFDTPRGKVTAGDSYSWQVAGAEYEVGYADKGRLPDAPADNRELMRVVSGGVAAQAAGLGGKVLSNGELTAAGLPAREVRIELPHGYVVSRVVAAGERFYQLTAILRKEPRALEAAARVFDSFRVIPAAEVEAAVRKQVAEATPDPLPQEPVARRPKSDAEDEGLRGRVKTVFTESEDLSGTWSAQGRKPSSTEHYDERGNLTKRESYDYKGNPSDITVYGYLDGERVSLTKSVGREYNPPAVMAAGPPGPSKPRRDPRYSYKFTFKYDADGRLLEKVWRMSGGELWLRYVYNYKGNQKETLVYSADGSLNQKYLYTLNDRGDKVEEVVYEAGDGSVRSRYAYSYESDAKGNWTKRVSSKWGARGGAEGFQPYSVYYRTITYY